MTVDKGADGYLVNQVLAQYYEDVTDVYSSPSVADTVFAMGPTLYLFYVSPVYSNSDAFFFI